MTFAAGIIPYTISNGEKFYLLGFENNKWSGFVGGSETDELPIDTAIREFNEETATVFKNNFQFIYSNLLNSRPIVDKTSTGKTVYIWFIEFPNETLNWEINKIFFKNQKFHKKKEYLEKEMLMWFSKNKLPSNVLYNLKRLL